MAVQNKSKKNVKCEINHSDESPCKLDLFVQGFSFPVEVKLLKNQE